MHCPVRPAVRIDGGCTAYARVVRPSASNASMGPPSIHMQYGTTWMPRQQFSRRLLAVLSDDNGRLSPVRSDTGAKCHTVQRCSLLPPFTRCKLSVPHPEVPLMWGSSRRPIRRMRVRDARALPEAVLFSCRPDSLHRVTSFGRSVDDSPPMRETFRAEFDRWSARQAPTLHRHREKGHR